MRRMPGRLAAHEQDRLRRLVAHAAAFGEAPGHSPVGDHVDECRRLGRKADAERLILLAGGGTHRAGRAVLEQQYAWQLQHLVVVGEASQDDFGHLAIMPATLLRRTMPAFTTQPDAVPAEYLRELREQIRKSPYFTVNNLNRDFVGTRGFSVVFRRGAIERVRQQFPWAGRYLDLALRSECNAFYLNPLQLAQGSHVAPHIDRSLRAYLLDVLPPFCVSVLYVEVPRDLRGGRLELRRGRRFVGSVTPREGLLVHFDGDLSHAVERVDSPGLRLSLVCEQYRLDPEELEAVPEFAIETRARQY